MGLTKKSASLMPGTSSALTKKNQKNSATVNFKTPLAKEKIPNTSDFLLDDGNIASRIRQMPRNKSRPCYREYRQRINTKTTFSGIMRTFNQKWKRNWKIFWQYDLTTILTTATFCEPTQRMPSLQRNSRICISYPPKRFLVLDNSAFVYSAIHRISKREVAVIIIINRTLY